MARPLVLSPEFPAGPEVRRGQPWRLQVVWMEPPADGPAQLDEAIRLGGLDGIGPDHVGFAVSEHAEEHRLLRVDELLATPGGGLARVRVCLTSPLFIRSRDQTGRRLTNRSPSFDDLLRASIRGVCHLLAGDGETLAREVTEPIIEAGARVALVRARYDPFSQRKWSNRTQERVELEGVWGQAIFEGVPLGTIPWLAWGGRLHVGTHRVAGAGGWVIVLD